MLHLFSSFTMNSIPPATLFYYLAADGTRQGAVPLAQLVEQFQLGQLKLSAKLVREDGSTAGTLGQVMKQADWWNKNHFSVTRVYCPFCHKAHEKVAKSLPILNGCKHCNHQWFPAPKSSLWQHAKASLGAWCRYQGRASVKEYLSYLLFYFFASSLNIYLGLGVSISTTTSSAQVAILDGQLQVTPPSVAHDVHPRIVIFMIIQIILCIPVICLTIRRLHDRGISTQTALALLFAANILMGLSATLPAGIASQVFLGLGIAVNIGTLLMCLQSGQITTNNYGPSTE